jgi:hypothetical protein
MARPNVTLARTSAGRIPHDVLFEARQRYFAIG